MGTGHAARLPRGAGHGYPDRPGAVPRRVRAPTAADPLPAARLGLVVGHPRRMPPLLTHNHAKAIFWECFALFCGGGMGAAAVFPTLWPTITLRAGVKAG